MAAVKNIKVWHKVFAMQMHLYIPQRFKLLFIFLAH